jgi:hypothetical protein
MNGKNVNTKSIQEKEIGHVKPERKVDEECFSRKMKNLIRMKNGIVWGS